MSWNQSRKPFSNEILHYIEKIDIHEDIKRISENIKIREVYDELNIEMSEELKNI